MPKILLSTPDVGALEEQYVLAALRSGWVAPVGPEVAEFEYELAQRVGAEHAVALSSGTAALHLALLAAGVGVGDTVVTSSMTFAATANAITYTGATPVFVDSDITTGNMDAGLLAEALAQLQAEGAKPKAILPVDLLGKAADYSSICEVADGYGIPVICDAAESLGAVTADGRPAGSWGLASAFSFNGNKIMTTSGGGMLVTDDAALADKARYLATQARQPVLHYEHTDIGYNYRLSNILSALGRAQLARLDSMISVRRQHRDTYRGAIAGLSGVGIFGGDRDEYDNCWLTAIIVDSKKAGKGAAQLQQHLNSLDIECRPLWKPMHQQPVFQGCRAFVNGNSDYLFENGLTLPSGSALAESDVRHVGSAIRAFFQGGV